MKQNSSQSPPGRFKLHRACYLLVALLLVLVAHAQVNRVEYYIDTDPGIGNGTTLNVYGDTVNFTTSITLTGVTPGSHRLYVRSCDVLGAWSLPYMKPIYVAPDPATPSVASIGRIEYFFDTDPGIGNGTYFSPGFEWAGQVSFIGLSPGAHKLYIRAADTDGKWSLPYCKNVFVIANPPSWEAHYIIGGEYFIDTDPGIGNGTTFTATYEDTVTNTIAVNLSGLSPGSHKLFLRYQSIDTKWSLPYCKSIYVVPNPVITDAPLISAMEYFYDNDPGFGNGISVPVPVPHDTLNSNIITDLSALSPGTHHMYLRARDSNGKWSLLTQKMVFVVPNPPANTTPQVAAMEYFIDSDPGIGNGTAMPVTAAVQTTSTTTADLSALSNGTHSLFVRARDALGRWSLPFFHSFSSGGNHAPYVQHPIPDQVRTMNFTSVAFANLDTVFADQDAPSYQFVYSLEVSGSACSATIDGGYLLRLVPITSRYGDATIVVTATDTGGAVARDTFNVYVSPSVNPPPAPTALTVTRSGDNAVLNWTQHDTIIASYQVQRYLVFYRSLWTYPWQYLYATNDAATKTFTHVGVIRFSTAMFYTVHAWSGSTDSFDRVIREIEASDHPITKEELLQRIGGVISPPLNDFDLNGKFDRMKR